MERRTPCPFASDICCRRGSASWQDNRRRRRCWNWLSELSAWVSSLSGPVHQQNRRPQSGISRLPATLAELRITMAADKTQALELPGWPPRELNRDRPSRAPWRCILIAWLHRSTFESPSCAFSLLRPHPNSAGARSAMLTHSPRYATRVVSPNGHSLGELAAPGKL